MAHDLDWFFEDGAGSAPQADARVVRLVKASSANDAQAVRALLPELSAAQKNEAWNGHNGLHAAASHGSADAAAALLEDSDIDVNARTADDRRTPLQLACLGGHAGVVRQLLKAGIVDVGAFDKSGYAAVHHAAFHGSLEVLMLLGQRMGLGRLRSCRSREDATPAMVAAGQGHTEAVRFLRCDDGAEGSDAEDDGAEAATSSGGHGLLHKAAQSGRSDVVVHLLQAGVEDVDIEDANGATPLILAAIGGHTEVMAELLDAGARLNKETHGGTTALHLCAYQNHAEAVALLLDKGADATSIDVAGHLPLHHAAASGSHQTTELLLKWLSASGTATAMLAAENADGQPAAVLASVNGFKKLSSKISRAAYLEERTANLAARVQLPSAGARRDPLCSAADESEEAPRGAA